MLKNLFISKVRIKLLEQLFLNPKEQYHVRGLVRILDEEINAIRRELLNLESMKLLRSEKMNNKVIYTLCPTNPIFEELRCMILKDSEIGLKLGKIAKSSGKTDVVILCEPYLTQKYNSDSEVDFLFIGKFDLRKLASEMKELETEMKKEFKYSAVTLQDFDFGKKKRNPLIVNVIERDFVVLYGSPKKLMV